MRYENQPPPPHPDSLLTTHSHNYIIKLIVSLTFCLILAGCESMALKKSGLYLNKSTSVEMNDFGVAKMRNQF